jgi:hypothetical protein
VQEGGHRQPAQGGPVQPHPFADACGDQADGHGVAAFIMALALQDGEAFHQIARVQQIEENGHDVRPDVQHRNLLRCPHPVEEILHAGRCLLEGFCAGAFLLQQKDPAQTRQSSPQSLFSALSRYISQFIEQILNKETKKTAPPCRGCGLSGACAGNARAAPVNRICT